MRLKWTMDDAHFLRRCLIVVGIGVLVLVAWLLIDVLLLVFGAVLVALVLRTISEPLCEHTFLSRGWSLAAAALFVFAMIATSIFLFGSEILAQSRQLQDQLPAAWQSVESTLGVHDLGERIAAQAEGATGGLLSGVAGYVVSAGSALADVFIVIIGGLYLAASPKNYARGFLMLFPDSQRERFGETFDASGRALKLWLLGQIVAMVMVGAATGIGLWLIGMPAPLALGLLAGLAEFVPLVGPILAAIPAVILAFGGGWEMVAWTLGLYLVIQQIEGNVLMPLVQQRAVDLPPALTLFAIVAAGVLFGLPGIIFATPLLVVVYVAVKKLYVRETLGEAVEVPGEEEDGAPEGNRLSAP